MPEDLIVSRHSNAIRTLTRNRPRIMNALNLDVIYGLKRHLEESRSARDVRVIILQGAGKHFSSGADMALLNEGVSPSEALEWMRSFGKLIRTMRELPLPIIVKLRGVAAGGGANLALAGDFVIASHDTRFNEIFINIGLILDGGGTFFLPRLVGSVKARELALLGKEISGEDAASMGLIYKSVPDDKLDHEVETFAKILARKPQSAMAYIKEGLEGSLGMTLKESLQWEASHQAIMLQSNEHKEAVGRFFESRGKKE